MKAILILSISKPIKYLKTYFLIIITFAAMPLYQKIVDMVVNTSNNSNATLSRGAIYCPDQLSVPSVSFFY